MSITLTVILFFIVVIAIVAIIIFGVYAYNTWIKPAMNNIFPKKNVNLKTKPDKKCKFCN